MNIKTRLSVQFTLLVAAILLVFSLLVYYFSYTSQLNKFRETLLEEAKNTAILFINVEEVDSLLMNKIHQSTISLEREEIALTDSSFKLIYSNNIRYLTPFVTKINTPIEEAKYFSIGEKDVVCFKHRFESKAYYVYVGAFDESRVENMKNLENILLWSTLFSLWLSVVFSYVFSKRAIRPISEIIRSVKEINSKRLNQRLNEGARMDEIDNLSVTFNEMLTNLEIAFRNQEDFVTNASHELRTPLSVMISESDYILSHEGTNSEYISHIASLLEDLKKLNGLITSLLDLAQINQNVAIDLSEIRIDEVVFSAIRQVKEKYPDRKIIPKINYPEDYKALIIKGNEGMLTIAFRNILDNACKFSTGEVNIDFSITAENIRIIVSDHGVGIEKSDIEDIFKPFKRGDNVKYIGGFGIGLALVAKIIDLNHAHIAISSRINEGTEVEVIFRKE
jgi:two-component system, OmpR family, sensor histidine kinase ArlS